MVADSALLPVSVVGARGRVQVLVGARGCAEIGR
jgi:hypothetical protein